MKLYVDEEIFDGAVRRGILEAEHSLRLATATLKNFRIATGRRRSQSLVTTLVKLARKGVDVRLLHAGIPSGDFRAEIEDIEPETFGVRRCVRVHFKAIVIDSKRLVMGSANLTGAGVGLKSARRRNFELAAEIDDAAAVDRVSELFDAIWDGTLCQTCDRREVCYAPLEDPWA